MNSRSTRNWGIGCLVVAGVVMFIGLSLIIYVCVNLKNQPSTTTQTQPGVVFQVRNF